MVKKQPKSSNIFTPEQEKYTFCPSCKTTLEWRNIDHEKHLACAHCDFIFWNNPKPVVSVVIVRNGKVLMLKRAQEPLKDYWVLPGGFMRYEETPEESTIREAKEETGLEIELSGLVGVYRVDNDPRGVHIDIVYTAAGKGKVKLSAEDNSSDFFDPDNLPELIAYKHREAIADWMETYGK